MLERIWAERKRIWAGALLILGLTAFSLGLAYGEKTAEPEISLALDRITRVLVYVWLVFSSANKVVMLVGGRIRFPAVIATVAVICVAIIHYIVKPVYHISFPPPVETVGVVWIVFWFAADLIVMAK